MYFRFAEFILREINKNNRYPDLLSKQSINDLGLVLMNYNKIKLEITVSQDENGVYHFSEGLTYFDSIAVIFDVLDQNGVRVATHINDVGILIP